MTRTSIALEGFGVPECLRWHDGALYFSDMALGVVHRWDGLSSTSTVVAEIPGRPAGLGWLPDGSMLVVSMENQCVYRIDDDGSTPLHADLRHLVVGHANDMLVTANGHAYVGSFGFDYHSYVRDRSNASLLGPPGPPTAALVHIAPDGTVLDSSAPLAFPNGCVAIDGGSTLVVAETLTMRLTAIPIDEDGVLGSPYLYASLVPQWLWAMVTRSGPVGAATRYVSALFDRPWLAKYSSSPMGPDGIANGPGRQIWLANALRGECVRVDEGGKVRQRVQTSQSTLACVIGGEDGRTLFAATTPTSDPTDASRLKHGRIEVARV
ncbi:SMP-30/gluconolactonase/LRE family protein [Mycobacterium sp. BMJ-28]